MSIRKTNTSKALAGTFRPDRARNETDGFHGLSPIDVARLSPAAREVLPEFVGVMRIVTLTTDNTPAFMQMVEAFAECRHYRAVVQREGAFIESVNRKTGSRVLRAHPGLAVVSAADKRFQRYADMFGMTPASRLKAQPVTDSADKKPNVFENI